MGFEAKGSKSPLLSAEHENNYKDQNEASRPSGYILTVKSLVMSLGRYLDKYRSDFPREFSEEFRKRGGGYRRRRSIHVDTTGISNAPDGGGIPSDFSSDFPTPDFSSDFPSPPSDFPSDNSHTYVYVPVSSVCKDCKLLHDDYYCHYHHYCNSMSIKPNHLLIFSCLT